MTEEQDNEEEAEEEMEVPLEYDPGVFREGTVTFSFYVHFHKKIKGSYKS